MRHLARYKGSALNFWHNAARIHYYTTVTHVHNSRVCSVGRLERNCAVLVCSEVNDGSCPQARRDSHFWASHISAITQGLKWRDERKSAQCFHPFTQP